MGKYGQTWAHVRHLIRRTLHILSGVYIYMYGVTEVDFGVVELIGGRFVVLAPSRPAAASRVVGL